jgi:TRAP-type C4-dicarboxylate transport system permease small subunit
MMLLIFFDVIFRYFGYPIRGAYDIVGLLGVAVIAIPIAYTQTVDGHISIGFIADRFPKKIRKFIDGTNCILNLSVYVLLVWQCSLYGKKLWTVGRVSETVEIPLYPFPYLIAFSCGLMCIVLSGELYFLIKRGKTK